MMMFDYEKYALRDRDVNNNYLDFFRRLALAPCHINLDEFGFVKLNIIGKMWSLCLFDH